MDSQAHECGEHVPFLNYFLVRCASKVGPAPEVAPLLFQARETATHASSDSPSAKSLVF